MKSEVGVLRVRSSDFRVVLFGGTPKCEVRIIEPNSAANTIIYLKGHIVDVIS